MELWNHCLHTYTINAATLLVLALWSVEGKLLQCVLVEERVGPLSVSGNGAHLPFRCRLIGKNVNGNLYLKPFKNLNEFIFF